MPLTQKELWECTAVLETWKIILSHLNSGVPPDGLKQIARSMIGGLELVIKTFAEEGEDNVTKGDQERNRTNPTISQLGPGVPDCDTPCNSGSDTGGDG